MFSLFIFNFVHDSAYIYFLHWAMILLFYLVKKSNKYYFQKACAKIGIFNPFEPHTVASQGLGVLIFVTPQPEQAL